MYVCVHLAVCAMLAMYSMCILGHASILHIAVYVFTYMWSLHRRFGAAVEWLDQDQLRAKYPWLNVDGLRSGVLGTASYLKEEVGIWLFIILLNYYCESWSGCGRLLH